MEEDARPTLTLSELRAMDTAVISRKDAAAALGVDPRTVTVGIEEGNIPAIRIGRRIVIPRLKFLALFENVIESE